MNKVRRNRLKAILPRMDEVTAIIAEVTEDIQGVLDDEEEAFENLPESIQKSERGQQMQDYIDTLHEIIDGLCEFDMMELYQKVEAIVEGVRKTLSRGGKRRWT